MDRDEMLLRAGYYAGIASRLLGDSSFEKRWIGHGEDITEADYMLMTSEIQRRLAVAGFIAVDEDPWDDAIARLLNGRLPVDHPDAPEYWQNETSGVLKPAVLSYLDGKQLTGDQLGAMKAYLRQWCNSPAWDLNPYGGLEKLRSLRARVAAISNYEELNQAIHLMTEMGMDPL